MICISSPYMRIFCQLFSNIPQGRSVVERVVGSLLVVPEKVCCKFLLKEVNISKKSVPMIVGELFLYGSVETFNVCVHTGTLRVGVEVDDVLIFKVCSEVFFKLRTIVCLYVSNSKWTYLLQFFEEVRC